VAIVGVSASVTFSTMRDYIVRARVTQTLAATRVIQLAIGGKFSDGTKISTGQNYYSRETIINEVRYDSNTRTPRGKFGKSIYNVTLWGLDYFTISLCKSAPGLSSGDCESGLADERFVIAWTTTVHKNGSRVRLHKVQDENPPTSSGPVDFVCRSATDNFAQSQGITGAYSNTVNMMPPQYAPLECR